MIHGLPAIAFLKRWELVLLRSAYEVNQVAVWFDLTWVLGYQVLENFVLAGCPVGKLQLLQVVGFEFIAKGLADFRARLASSHPASDVPAWQAAPSEMVAIRQQKCRTIHLQCRPSCRRSLGLYSSPACSIVAKDILGLGRLVKCRAGPPQEVACQCISAPRNRPRRTCPHTALYRA